MDILKIDNVDEMVGEKCVSGVRQVNKLAPKHPFRMLICGSSGGGKGNLLLNLVTKLTCWDKIYYFSKHLEQTKNVWLKQHLTALEDTIEKQTKHKFKIIEKWETELDSLPKVEDFDKSYRNLVIIDDHAETSKANMKRISDLFIRSRHRNVSIIMVTQLYFSTPRPIRINTSYLALFSSFNRREQISLSVELGGDLPKKKFNQLYNAILEEPYSFMYIDNTTTDRMLRYRKQLNYLYEGDFDDPGPVDIEDFIETAP